MFSLNKAAKEKAKYKWCVAAKPFYLTQALAFQSLTPIKANIF